jgi:HK97 family phage major capsid protein
VQTLSGQADVALQMLEQSPQGASLDWALLKDLAESYDQQLETSLLVGQGSDQVTGVVTAATNSVTYTSGSPTATAMWPYFGKMAASIGDNRKLPPQAWLVRTSRWAWLSTAEDSQNRPLGISSPFFVGSSANTPEPVGGLIGWPVILNDAIPANLGTGTTQDEVVLVRPSDLLLLEGQPKTLIAREPLSGSLGVRIQMHCSSAFLIRWTTGIAVGSGTGFAVQAGF